MRVPCEWSRQKEIKLSENPTGGEVVRFSDKSDRLRLYHAEEVVRDFAYQFSLSNGNFACSAALHWGVTFVPYR